jgi:hypothetical protein
LVYESLSKVFILIPVMVKARVLAIKREMVGAIAPSLGINNISRVISRLT